MDGPSDSDALPGRRGFLGGLGALGGAALAGCSALGGDGGDGGDGDGNTFKLYARAPVPTVDQHNPYSPGSLATIAPWCRHSLVELSAVDSQPVGDLAADWSYEAGVIDLELHDDFYWWDDTNVTVEDLTTTLSLNEHVRGEGEYPLVEEVERTGEHTVRFRLTEAVRETPAIVRTLVGIEPYPHEIFDEWLGRFEDATTREERLDLLEEIATTRIDEPIRPFYNAPFEMVDVTETAYELALRTDADPTPHYVEEIDFERVVVEINNESFNERVDFNDGAMPYSGLSTLVDGQGFDFDTEVIGLVPASSPGSYVFNCASGPTAVDGFRRAFALMLDREQAAPMDVVPDEVPTGLTGPAAEEQYFGELLDSFESYGVDEVRESAAESAMRDAGFERNSAGDWLFQSGPRAGEPISITITTAQAMNAFSQVSEPFAGTMREFGIDLTYETIGDQQSVFDQLASGNFTVAMGYWGGNVPLPSNVYRNVFIGESAAYGNTQFPTSWEGPPVGEPDAEGTTTHDVETAASEVDVLTDDAAHETALHRLGWVFNRALPKLPIGSFRTRYRLNTESWDWQLPVEENPDAWLEGGLDETSWTMGLVARAGESGDDA